MLRKFVLITSAVAAALTSTIAPTTAVRLVDFSSLVPVFDPEPFSPAKCAIQYVSNAHPSDDAKNKVKVAAKVNSRTQCATPVELLTLQVVIMDVTTGESFRWEEDTQQKPYVLNQGAFLPCVKFDEHIYKGFALGTSTEDGKLYMQEKEGNLMPVKCSRD